MTRVRIFQVGGVLICTALVAALIVKKRDESRQRYQGKTLPEWFDLALTKLTDSHAEPYKFEEIVQAFGTNGVPFYLETLTTRPSIRDRVATLIPQARLDPLQETVEELRVEMAGEALCKVASENPAIAPTIAHTAERIRNWVPLRSLCRALAATGTNGVPYLISLATNNPTLPGLPGATPALESLLESQADYQTKTNIAFQVNPQVYTNILQPLPATNSPKK